MATKMCFRVNENKVFDEEIVTFTYVKGMAFSQKCKNVLSFHSSIQEQFPTSKILIFNNRGEQFSKIQLTLIFKV